MALKNKYMKRIMPSEKRISDVGRWVNRRGMIAVFAARLLPVVRGAIPIPAGFLKISFKKFVFCIALSSVVWCFALIGLGVKLGQNWRQIYEIAQNFEIPTVVLIITGAMILVRQRKLHRKRGK